MALTLKLDDIKPLLGAVGLGDDTPKPAGVDATPGPPPPPAVLPPTPAAAGFSAWAADPKNSQKVADGITQPGSPLLPPAPTQQPFYGTVAPPPPAPPANAKGLISPGNINLYDRPIVPNPYEKGESSTLYSSGFDAPGGRALLVPRVSNGADNLPPHVMSNPEALAYYRKTKESLGTFDNQDDATAYGQALHLQQAALGEKNGRTVPLPRIQQQPAPTPPPLASAQMPSSPPTLGANIPLPPGAGQMASVNPPKPPSPAFLNPPTPSAPPTQAQDMAANPDQYQKPNLVGQGWKSALLFGIPAALQSAGSGLSNMGRGNPTAGMSLINDQVAHDRGVPAANAEQYNSRIIQPLKDAASLADTQSQTAQRNSAANKSDSAADLMAPFTMTAEQAKAINQPGLAGTQTTMRDYNKLVGMAGNNNTSQANNKNTNETKVATNQTTNDTKKTIADAANERAKSVSDAANKTKVLMQGMRDSTSRANNENTVSNKGTTGAGGFKVPADVTKRASLAANVNENADAVEQLVQKRPDMLGAEGGRYTNVQQMIGSNDPDIHEMGVRMHNIALASNGAHGVRAQGAIQKTEDELFNNFKSGPQGIAGSLKATRGSMQTFLNDEQNFQSSGKRTGGITPAPTGGAPKEGDAKTNSHGDKVKFSGGKWGPA